MLGIGRSGPADLVFSRPDGPPLSPVNLSRDWRRAVKALELPPVMFHALRHSSASVLIAAGLDVGSISRRLGHANPATTLRIYTHHFAASNTAAAKAIERAMVGRKPHAETLGSILGSIWACSLNVQISRIDTAGPAL